MKKSLIAAVLAAVLLLPGSAEDATTLALPEGDAPAETNTVPCSLPEVLFTAIRNNASIDIARLDPEIVATGIGEAKGLFDQALGLSFSSSEAKSEQPLVSSTSFVTPTGLGDVADGLTRLDRILTQLQGPQTRVVSARQDDTTLSVQQLFTTGTQLSLNGGVVGSSSDVSDDAYSSNLNLGLRQPLLRGFGRRIGTITIRQAQNQAQQSEQGFLATVLSTMRQVEVAYWDLVLAHELLKIREFGVTLAQGQFDRSQVRFQVGKGIEADVLAATAELATRRADLSDAQADIRARSITLLQLIKPAGRGAWTVTLEPEAAPEVTSDALDPELSVAAALEKRPDLKQADLEVERQALDVRLRKNDLLPNLDLVANYGRNGNSTSFGGSTGDLGSSRLDQYSVGVEFQTSLTKRSEKARYQRAKLSKEQAARVLRRSQDSVEAEVRQAVISAQKLRQRADANTQAVAARQEELTIEQGRNQAGKTTTLDVLQVQRDLLQSQLDEASTRIGYMQALAGLYAAEGTLLERHGIAVETQED